MSSASQSAVSFTLHRFFAPGGILAKAHPAYEFRRGQLEMAQAVEAAIEEKRHLIVEAGTGTGKTLAYLAPVIRSGKRVIISTGTKNLQEQLFYKDIPFLQSLFAPEGSTECGSWNCQPPSRLLHEGTQQLSLPQKVVRAHRSAGPEWARRDQPVPRHRRLGEGNAERRSRRTPRPAGDKRALVQVGRARRHLHRPEMHAVRPLLHHRDAPPRCRERHHHRQPSSVLRRPGDQDGGRRCA